MNFFSQQHDYFDMQEIALVFGNVLVAPKEVHIINFERTLSAKIEQQAPQLDRTLLHQLIEKAPVSFNKEAGN